MTPLEKAILRTLAYADIFSYPLKEDEIVRWLVSEKPFDKVKEAIPRLVEKKYLAKKREFYCLRGRKEIIAIRRMREVESRKKVAIARKLVRFLRIIPSVRMVALTGSLAMMNTEKEEDIDLMIVAENGRIWLTRLMVNLITELVAKRRKPGEKSFKDKICLNMFLEERKMGVLPGERNLFTAHEVCQMRPLWERNGIYQKFLEENQWSRSFLPNWKPSLVLSS